MIDDDEVKPLIEAYRQAELDIIEAIKKSSPETLAGKKALLVQIRSIIAALENETTEFINENVDKTWKQSADEVDNFVIDKDFEVLIDKEAISFLVQNKDEIKQETLSEFRSVLSNTNANLIKMLNQTDRQVKNELLGTITSGKVRGIAQSKIKKELVYELEKNGLSAITIIDKNDKQRKYSLSAYAEALSRSALIKSSANATITRCANLGVDLVRVSRHAKPSRLCEMWQGQILSISGQDKKYPALQEALFKNYKDGGLFHTYCRHSLSPFIDF